MCVYKNGYGTLYSTFHPTNDFAAASSGKLYIPVNILYKGLSIASNPNGFLCDLTEPNTQSHTFIYTNSLGSRNIT